MEGKNILVVAAHPDDEILGVGGTIKKYTNQGAIARCIILGEGMTSRDNFMNDNISKYVNKLHSDTLKACENVGYKEVIFCDFPDNRFDSVDLLDIVKEVEKYIEIFKPEIIYTHHNGDLNIDHRMTYEAVLTASRPIGDFPVKQIYTFETPSSTEWNFSAPEKAFIPNIFVDIEDTLADKLDAMSCYLSEVREYPHPRSLEALEIIAARWGTVVGKRFVEAFKLIRSVD